MTFKKLYIRLYTVYIKITYTFIRTVLNVQFMFSLRLKKLLKTVLLQQLGLYNYTVIVITLPVNLTQLALLMANDHGFNES